MAESEIVQKARIKSLLNECLTDQDRFELFVTLARDPGYPPQVIISVFKEAGVQEDMSIRASAMSQVSS